MERICNKCNKTLSISLFTKNKKMVDGYEHKCRSCTNLALRNKIKFYRSISSKIKSLIGCDICKENREICLDYNHLYNKTDDVSMIIDSSGFPRIFEEIKKCIVLCANCHRLWHHYEKKGLTYEQTKQLLRPKASISRNCEGGWYCI